MQNAVLDSNRENVQKTITKVSIIIPVHNAVSTIERAVESCILQRGIDVEIILVENGSSDGSDNEVDKIAKKYDKVIAVHESKKGVSNARNVGIRLATGTYIGFVDADDYIEPNMYYTLADRLETEGRNIAICDYFRFGQGVAGEKDTAVDEISKLNESATSIISALLGQIKPNDPIVMGSVWRCLFSHEMLIERKLFFEEKLAIGEDQMFLLEALKNEDKVSLVPQPLYHYYISSASVSNCITTQTWKKYCCFFYRLICSEFYNGEYKERVDNKIRKMSQWLIKELIAIHSDYKEYKSIIGEVTDDWSALLGERVRNKDYFEQLLYRKNYFMLFVRYNLLLRIKRAVYWK